MQARTTGITPQANDTRALEAAAATRMLVAERILDYSGHVSIRIPGKDAFVIQIGSNSRAEVEPGSMLVVDYDGKVLEGEGQPPSEIPIHIEILKARPDVQAVLHSHMELAIAFTMMEGVTLQPMRARASRWKSGIPIDGDPSHIKTPEQGKALAKTLGPHHAVLMRAHGLTLVAESAQALFIDAVHFKENATAQMQALQAGAKPLPLTDAEIEQIEKMEMRDWHIKKLWNYYVRKGLTEGVLPGEWGEPLIPTTAMLTRDRTDTTSLSPDNSNLTRSRTNMRALSLAEANKIIEGTFKSAKKRKAYALAACVLDAGGRMKAFQKQDGASLMRFEIAYGKAFGSLSLNRSSRQILQKFREKPYFMGDLHELADGPLFMEGGGQLIRDPSGEIVGAIGVTGDVNEVDDLCAIDGIHAGGFLADADFDAKAAKRLNIKVDPPLKDPRNISDKAK